MQDDFDDGMGIPDDELAGESTMGEGDGALGLEHDEDLDVAEPEMSGRASGGPPGRASRPKASLNRLRPRRQSQAPAKKAAPARKKAVAKKADARKAAKAVKKTAKKGREEERQRRRRSRPEAAKRLRRRPAKKAGGKEQEGQEDRQEETLTLVAFPPDRGGGPGRACAPPASSPMPDGSRKQSCRLPPVTTPELTSR